MEFSAILDREETQSSVTYSCTELSFNTVHCSSRLCSLTFGEMYLSLDIADDSGTVCSISGFCPLNLWEERSITIPNAAPGTLKCLANDMNKGCGYPIQGSWRIYYDPSAMIAMITLNACDNSQNNKLSNVRFLDNAIAVLDGTELTAVYIEKVSICKTKS